MAGRPTAKRSIGPSNKYLQTGSGLTDMTQLTCVPFDTQQSTTKPAMICSTILQKSKYRKIKKKRENDGVSVEYDRDNIIKSDFSKKCNAIDKKVDMYAKRLGSVEKKFSLLMNQNQSPNKPNKKNQILFDLKDSIKRMQSIKKQEKKLSFVKSMSKSPEISRSLSQKLFAAEESPEELSRFQPFLNMESRVRLNMFNRKLSDGKPKNSKKEHRFTHSITDFELSRDIFERVTRKKADRSSFAPQKTITMYA